MPKKAIKKLLKKTFIYKQFVYWRNRQSKLKEIELNLNSSN